MSLFLIKPKFIVAGFSEKLDDEKIQYDLFKTNIFDKTEEKFKKLLFNLLFPTLDISLDLNQSLLTRGSFGKIR